MSELPALGLLVSSPPSLLRVALVGVGRWGKKLLRVFSGVPRARVVAVCDRDTATLSGVARAWPSVEPFPSYERLLERSGVDAVVVATPSFTHAKLGLQALDAGKHVFIEKPMATCLQDAVSLHVRAQNTRKRLMVGHVLQYHPSVAQLCAAIGAGALGEPRFVCSQRIGLAPSKAADPWWELAPHDLSLLRLMTGQDARLVCAMRRPDASVTAGIVLSNGIQANLTVGRFGRPSKVRCTLVVGTEGVAVFDELNRQGELKLFRGQAKIGDWICAFAKQWPGIDTELIANGISSLGHFEPTSMPAPPGEPLAIEAAHFVTAILDSLPMTSDADDGLRVVSALDAGARSMARGGRPMQVAVRPPTASPRARADELSAVEF